MISQKIVKVKLFLSHYPTFYVSVSLPFFFSIPFQTEKLLSILTLYKAF